MTARALPTAADVLRVLADALTRPLEDGETRMEAVYVALEDATGRVMDDDIAAVLREVADGTE